jgi:hypothetical protein
MVEATNTSGDRETAVTPISTGVRSAWGFLVGGIMLVCWMIGTGDWPDLDSSWWYWVLCSVVAILVAWFSPVVVMLWRMTRAVARAQSPSPQDRLAQPGFWTEVEHIPDAGATQVMRMEDDNFIMLSAGTTTLKVYVTPRLDELEAFRELATFSLENVVQRVGLSRQQRAQDDEQHLERLRKTIGWPKTVDELRRTLQNLSR